MTFDVRVRRVSAIATGKPEHLRADTLDYSASLSEVAALRLQLSQHAKVNGSLRAGEELALEIWNGSQWTEGEQSRFTSLGLSLDELDPTMATQLDVVEYVSFRLSKALHDVQSDRSFTDVTPGYIVHTLLTEAKSRGAVEGVSWTFTPTLDSTGTPWPKAVTIDLPPDQSALDTLGVFVDAGYIDWTTRGRELVLYVKENAGRRHPFTIGMRALERPLRSSLADAATAVTVRLDDGKFIRKAGNASLGLGVLERAISASGVTDDATANVLLDAELAAGAPKSELTISENAETLDRVPLVNYDLGDWVWVRRAGAAENVRVSGVQVRKNKGESPAIDIVLMDKIADNAARLAKAARAVGRVGGNGRFKGSGGGGGAEVRYGTVTKDYPGYGSDVRVIFDGSAEPSPAMKYLVTQQIGPNDRVAVVGDFVVGRPNGTPGLTVPGTVEYLEPAAGWIDEDSTVFGPLRVQTTANGWVFIGGRLRPEDGVARSGVVAIIPGAYRPKRTGTMNFIVSGSNASTLSLNLSTGELSISSRVTSVPLDSVAFNLLEDRYVNATVATYGEITVGILDTDGFVSSVNWTASSAYKTESLPVGALAPEHRPAEDTTMLGGVRHNSAFGSTFNIGNRTVKPDGSITDVSANSYYGVNGLDFMAWETAGAGNEWQRLGLINGYTHHNTQPIMFTRTRSGIVRLKGGGGGGGVVNATIGILPQGFRPSYQLWLGNGLVVNPSGAISRLSNTAMSVTSNTPLAATAQFVAGR